MGLPEPDFFTEKELAKRWEKIHGECPPALVRRYIETKKLKAESVYSPTSTSSGGFVNAWRDEHHPAREHGRKIVGYNIALAEVLRFEAENPPEENKSTENSPKAISADDNDNLLKGFVKKAAIELYEEAGKFPKHRDVLINLRRIANNNDQIGEIVKEVHLENGVSIVGRVNPIAVKTIQNWLVKIKEEVINK